MAALDSQKSAEVKENPNVGASADAATKLSHVGNQDQISLAQARSQFIRAPLPETPANIYQTADAKSKAPDAQTPAEKKAHPHQKDHKPHAKPDRPDEHNSPVTKKGTPEHPDPIRDLLEKDPSHTKNLYVGDGGLHRQTKDDSATPTDSNNHQPVKHMDPIGRMIESWPDGTTVTHDHGKESIQLLTGDNSSHGVIDSLAHAPETLGDLAKSGMEAVQNGAKQVDILYRNLPVNAKNVENSVDAIHNARGTFTTDGGAITDALKNQNEASLRAIQARYKEKFGTPLRDQLKHDFDIPLVGDAFGKGEKAEALLDKRDDVNLKVEQLHIDDSAKTNLSPKDYEHFKQQMAAFEKRGTKDNLSNEEVARTYKEISKVLDTQGEAPLKTDQRKKVAMEIMDNAADPTSIAQGFNKTCNVTTIETSTYTKSPSDAARVVGDIARTGTYVDHDGVMIKSSPEPRTEPSAIYPVPDGTRNHASEIFQIAAVNLSYKQRGVPNSYDQLSIKPPQNATDNGERLYNNSNGTQVEVKNFDGNPTRAPGLFNEDYASLRKGITGKDDLTFLQSDSYFGQPAKPGTTNITSEQQLNDQLADAKKNGKFPIIVGVNTNNDPFWTDSGGGAAGGSGGAHVITVTDYSPGPPAHVNLENQWGKSSSYQGDKTLDTHELFDAMQTTQFNRDREQGELVQERKDGKLDFGKEIDVLRLDHTDRNKISDVDFEQQHAQLTDRVIDYVRKNDLPADEKAHYVDQLAAAGSNMSVNAQLDSITKMHDGKVSSNGDFQWSLTLLGHRLAQERKKIDSGELPETARARYEAKSSKFMHYIHQLPVDQQNYVTDNLKRLGDD